MVDLGGSDPLSLIRYYGNGSYLRYGNMGFHGCTLTKKYPDSTHLDSPKDPTYYSLGNLDIDMDIVRVPQSRLRWFQDDGAREAMSMDEAVALLNTHVAAYYARISGGSSLCGSMQAEFTLTGEGTPNDVLGQHMHAAGLQDCRGELAESEQCTLGAPGGINRILLTDVTATVVVLLGTEARNSALLACVTPTWS